MALMKEPSGLVYNTDGTLCTTYRDDDVPFRGVRSLAVEAGTTNLVPSNIASFTSLSGLNSDSIISREIIEGGGYGGRNAIKIVKNSVRTNFQIYSDILRNNILNNIQVGDRISYQIKYKVLDAGKGGFICNFRTWEFGDSYPKTIVDIGNGWFLQYGTSRQQWTESSAITGNCGIAELPANSTILFSDFQVEIKNYSTSFVDGSRPNGIMYIPAEDLDTKDYTLEDGSRVKLFNNHVISLWFKVPKVQPNEINSSASIWQVLQQIVGNHYDLLTGSHRYRQWGIAIFAKTGHLFVSAPFLGFGMNADGTVLASAGTFEDVWHNLVFTFNVLTESSTKIIREHKVYYDGEHVKSTTYNLYPNTGTYGNSFINDNLYFYEDTYNRSNLVSNIFIGEYRKPNGAIIWTDDYIREVYESQIPFTNQPSISIY